jgi:hypothetical protein
MCGKTLTDRAAYEALAWLDAYERHGGRVICDGRMFVVTPPCEDIDLPPCPDVVAVAWLAFARERRRRGLDPGLDPVIP